MRPLPLHSYCILLCFLRDITFIKIHTLFNDARRSQHKIFVLFIRGYLLIMLFIRLVLRMILKKSLHKNDL